MSLDSRRSKGFRQKKKWRLNRVFDTIWRVGKVEDVVKANGAKNQERQLETPKETNELYKAGNAILVYYLPLLLV